MVKHKKLFVFSGIALIVLLAMMRMKSYFAETDTKANKAVAVSASKVSKKTVNVTLQEAGTVQAYRSVAIKSRVDGQLLEIGFTRGSFVKPGQLLFHIDSKPYQAALAQAQANLARDRAQLNNAQLQLQRSLLLVKKGFLSKQDFDQIKANAESAKATVAADTAAEETAQLNLSYSTITAPIAGRIGDYLVNIGNLIRSSDNTTLAVINQVNPIDVSFAVPEKYFTELNEAQSKAPVQVHIQINDKTSETGVITLINNAVDNTTGMLTLKATFSNTDQMLWPGAFVQVEIPVARLNDALLIPSRAVQEGQQGSYVYVVNKDNTVSYRPIKIGPAIADETVVASGLNAGEAVVTDGVLRLTEGSLVRIIKS